MRKKTILITNDDGYGSAGIRELCALLEEKYIVYVVAPDRERSAVSMAITLNRPLRIKKIESRVFAVDGTPSDCVNIALQKILPHAPHLIVSGMNKGENISYDVLYSGTVGAAFTAHLYGLPALAVSLISGRNSSSSAVYDFSEGARIAARVVDRLLKTDLRNRVYNLNIPFHNNGKIRVTGLGDKRYKPEVVEKKDPRGARYYWLGTGSPEYNGADDTDVGAVRQGYVSLSILQYNLSDNEAIEMLKREMNDS